MTAAWTTLRSGRSALPENFKAWLFGTARHMLSGHLREKSARGNILAFEPDAYDFEDQRALDDFREVEYEQGLPRFLELVDSAIESMPAKYRDVIRINMRDGKTGRALAAQVGVTPAEASRLLNEGRPKLVDAVATLLMARTCREACPKFDSCLQTAGWAGGPFSDGLRRRLMQHISGCSTCKSARSRDKWIVFLPGLVPVLVAPELHQRIVNVALATKDVSLPSSLDSNHRVNSGNNASGSSPSTPSGPTYRFASQSGSTNTLGSPGEINDSPAGTSKGKKGKGNNNILKRGAGIVSSVAFILLLALLGISAHSINTATGTFVSWPLSAPINPAGPSAVKDTTPPPSGGSPSRGTSPSGHNLSTGISPVGHGSEPVGTCSPGQHSVGTTCIPNQMVCRPGEHLVGSTCQPNLIECKSGEHLVGSTCKPNETKCLLGQDFCVNGMTQQGPTTSHQQGPTTSHQQGSTTSHQQGPRTPHQQGSTSRPG
jgi:RNA polymerase sigma factor (sigma-70 family)